VFIAFVKAEDEKLLPVKKASSFGYSDTGDKNTKFEATLTASSFVLLVEETTVAHLFKKFTESYN
jgi:hypothetical protein